MQVKRGVRSGVITRRRMVGSLGALAVLAAPRSLLARQATPEGGEGGWSFTDDAGKALELPERPLRIAADLNAASALWDFGIRPVAIAGYTVDTDASWGNVARDTPVINVAAGSPTPDLESLLAVKAGQVFAWNQDFIQSYQGLTADLETMLAALETAQKVTG